MVAEFLATWLAKQLLDYGLTSAKSQLKAPKIIEAFEKACLHVVKVGDVPVNEISTEALSSEEGILQEEALWNKLDQSFARGDFPDVQHLTDLLVESWRARKEQLQQADASDFFSLSEELVYPILREISERFFVELAQIPELLCPFIIQSIQKSSGELFAPAEIAGDLESIDQIIFSQSNYPVAIVNENIVGEVERLRKSRFFKEYDAVHSSSILARRLVDGDLSGGTGAVKCRALAWCARLLSRGEGTERAEEYLKLAKKIGSSDEIIIADAFILSQKGDKSSALRMLGNIDTPMSRSAAFMVVVHHEDSHDAIDWLKKVYVGAAELDSEGKHSVVLCQLRLGLWEEVKETLKVISDDDLVESPVLYRAVALIHLLHTVPLEYYSAVCSDHLPIDAAAFPLASDTAGLESRRTAHNYFISAVEIEQQLNCPRAAAIDDDFALWLELKSPESFEKGKERLESKLRDLRSALHLVPLGLQFGIELELQVVKQEIERQIALHGGITRDAAIARFAITFTQKTPKDAAAYIDEHYGDLSKFLNKESLQSLQIELFSKAGSPNKANDCLDLLLETGISKAEEGRLRRIISEAEGTDPVWARKEQFEQTDSLDDLLALVSELGGQGKWESLCEYGKILFEKTLAVRDAERLANAMSNAHKNKQLVTFLRSHTDLLEQSKVLQRLFCWGLYSEGEILEARSELVGLNNNDRENPEYRALEVNIGITLGDWSSLATFVANEYQERRIRSAEELIGAAKLAFHLGSPHAKDLLFSAVAKGEDDASVLVGAYFLAAKAGWEDSEVVGQWVQKGVALSGEEGPIQQVSLEDLLQRKPEWDRLESKTLRLLSRGEIPMFLAAQSLNKSLVDLMLFPALANLLESDPRRRGIVPAYSGKRQPMPFDIAGTVTVGIDATALLTLGFLDLLDKALDAFKEVHVPHSTLAWLFEEKQKAAFHQPSRIRNAHKIRHLLSVDVLEKFTSSTVVNSDLVEQVGDDLAMYIAEAEEVRDDDDTQRIVIQPAPVYRVASLMKEEVDLTVHSTVIGSCLSVVEKLRQNGQVTAKEERRAYAYLQLHEIPWPDQPNILKGATLYLSDLAITYFLHLGILEKLKEAGFNVVISPREVAESNALIAYETTSGKVNEVIERIRDAVNLRIESGQIKLGRWSDVDRTEDNSISGHPTVTVMALAQECDAIIADERFLNQHAYIKDGHSQKPLFTTLDLLDALASVGAITSADLFEHRTRLRRAGYLFVSASDTELTHHLNASSLRDGKVVETAELKAIRENLLRIRMSDYLQLPQESSWLHMILKGYVDVLRNLWKEDSNLSSVIARSNWILDQVDVRGWAHCFDEEIRSRNIISVGLGVYVLMLLLPPSGATEEAKNAYWSWLEDTILLLIKEEDSDLYDWLVEWQKRKISEMADMELNERGLYDE